MIAAEDFDYGDCSENPPRIIGWTEQEDEIKWLLERMKSKLDDEGRDLLYRLLKKWGPFYLNSSR